MTPAQRLVVIYSPSQGGGVSPPAGFAFLAFNNRALTLNGRTLMLRKVA